MPLEELQQLRGKAGEGVGSKSKGESSSSSSLSAAVCPPSLGDFTAAEYDRLSRQIPEKLLDARDKSHYRAFDEVCFATAACRVPIKCMLSNRCMPCAN